MLSFCNSPQVDAPAAYIRFKPGLITEDGQVTNDATTDFLKNGMTEFHAFVARVTSVLPKGA